MPLSDLRVIDLSTVIAGPGCAKYLADFGAEVIKVERPGAPDSTRTMGLAAPDGTDSLFHKQVNRNKRCIELDLKDPEGRATAHRLIDTADVVVENLRPGGLERLGLGPDALLATNPRLVVCRITGFGQDGPYAHRPGFATLAEAMSGFAGLNGDPDGPPTLPPIALTDEITALAGAFSVLVALRSGVGQVVDVNLLEVLVQLMGNLPAAWLTHGYLQPRLGSGIAYSVPRGTYRCADGAWVAISTSAESVARRVMVLVGAGDDERFATSAGRVAHREEVESLVAAWVAARPRRDVLDAFTAVEAAIAPVYAMDEVVHDPHVVARGTITELDGIPMQGLISRLSATPGRLRWAGRAVGADTAAVLAELAQAATSSSAPGDGHAGHPGHLSDGPPDTASDDEPGAGEPDASQPGNAPGERGGHPR